MISSKFLKRNPGINSKDVVVKEKATSLLKDHNRLYKEYDRERCKNRQK